MIYETEAERLAYAAGVHDGRGQIIDVALTASLAPAKVNTGARSLKEMEDIAAQIDPYPFSRAEALSPQQAAHRAGVSVSTIRQWVDRFKIGRKIGGRTWVSHIALDTFMSGDFITLEAVLRGYRPNPVLLPARAIG